MLSDIEISETKNIVSNYGQIRDEIHMRLMRSPLLHNVMNHPDEDYLKGLYPQNILADMPSWVREHLARKESQQALERLADAIMSDDFLLDQYMIGYDISQHGLDSYHDPFEDEDYEPEEFDDAEYDFSGPEDEETFKAMHNEWNERMEGMIPY